MRTGIVKIAREIAYIAAVPHIRRALRDDQPDFEAMHARWHNPSAGHPTFLAAVDREARQASGPALECGSGLTTLVLAHAAELQCVSLESSQEWARINSRRAWLAGLRPTIAFAPLRRYNGFHWYSVAEVDLRRSYRLVVCDGPPSVTLGGRYGLLPVLRDRLSGARILLDDVDRPGERSILRRWEIEFGTTTEVIESPGEKSFAVVDVPSS